MFDFGSIPDQSTVKHSFWFKSVGTDTVRISKIATTCQCTTMPLTRDWVAPGDSMLVSVFWELGRRIGKVGQYPSALLVDDPKPHYMSLIGQVVKNPNQGRPVSISPYKGELARTATRSIDSVGFILTNHGDEDLTVNVVSPPPDECFVSFPGLIPAGGQAAGHIKLKPEFSDGEFMSSVTLEFEGEIKSRLTIPIRRKAY